MKRTTTILLALGLVALIAAAVHGCGGKQAQGGTVQAEIVGSLS